MDLTISLIAVAFFLLTGYLVIAKHSNAATVIPFHLLILYLGLRLARAFVQEYFLIGEWKVWLDVGLNVILAWAIVRLTFSLLIELPLQFWKKTPIPSITRGFILLVCYSILFFIVFRVQRDFNLAVLITTSAALTVILGLAAQTTLGSFFSGLVLQVERPFQISDWIQFNEHIGRVVSITWQSTRIVTRNQELIYIPNAQLANTTIKNFSKPEKPIVARLYVGIEYGAPPNLVRKTVLKVLEQHPKVLNRPKPELRLIEFGDFSITYELFFYHANYAQEPRLKADINNRIWYALRRNNIVIPFPIRDVRHAHLERRRIRRLRDSINRDLEGMMKNVSILSPLTDEDRAQIAHSVSIKDYSESEFIVKEGNPGASLFIIISGLCEVLITDKNNDLEQVATLERGDFFGEMSLLTGEPRKASVRVLEDATAVKLEKATFSAILMANPSICDQIGEIVAKRRQKLDEKLASILDIPETSQGMIEKIRLFFGL